MHHFPDNTISSFITGLPHSIMLHRQWEVAISEIQFPCTFLHVRHNENVIRFVDVKPDEGTNDAFTNGIYNDIHELINAINIAYKSPNCIFILNSKKYLTAKYSQMKKTH